MVPRRRGARQIAGKSPAPRLRPGTLAHSTINKCGAANGSPRSSDPAASDSGVAVSIASSMGYNPDSFGIFVGSAAPG
jgi:hypothetical protein